MRPYRNLLVGMFVSACFAATAWALPGQNDWMRGAETEPFQEKTDRLFLVNRGWVSGTVGTISATDITITEQGTAHTFPRSEVSLVELSDWLNPEKRRGDGEIKVRVELEGPAECGDFFFADGTIITRVDAVPTYAAGKDQDDRVEIGRTRLRFEKGRDDRSVTVIRTDLTLLPGDADVLHCEAECARANVRSGPCSVRFLDPSDGSPLAVMKEPAEALWFRFDVPLSKLSSSRYPYRGTAETWHEVDVSRISSHEPSSPSHAKAINKARCILSNGRILEGALVGLNETTLLLQMRRVGAPERVPRSLVAFIELYDWERRWRDRSLTEEWDETVTPPLRIVFAGSSSEGQIVLRAGDSIHELIVPPHHVSVRDADDCGFVKNEREMGYRNGRLDRSLTQVELIVRLKLNDEASFEARVHNHYTNILAGDMQLSVYDALSGRKIWRSSTGDQEEQQWVLDIGRSRLFR